MRKIAAVFMVIVAGLASVGICESEELGVSFDVTYMSKFMDHGEEYFGEQGGWEESLEIDLWDSGFGIGAAYRHAGGGGYVDSRRGDYSVYYGNTLFDGQRYATSYRINWIYHNFPDRPRNADNTQELEAVFAWERLFSSELIPVYAVCYEYPAGSGYDNRNMAGFIHTFAFEYPAEIEWLHEPLDLSAELEYRDGLGGGDIDHDFSHITLGASSAFELAEGLYFTPGVYYQITMDDSVCDEDVLYTALNMHYEF